MNSNQQQFDSDQIIEELKARLQAERQRAEKAEKRLKKIFKRGLRFEDLGLKEVFFGFLKNLKIKTIQTTISKFQFSRIWLKNNLSQGNPLAYFILIILISLFVIPSSFLVGQLGKLITQSQTQKQQTQQQHFSTGELNLADNSINSLATSPATHTHIYTVQTKEDFEGTIPNDAKGFGYGTGHPPGKVVPVTGPEISPDASTVGLWHMNNNWDDSKGTNHGTVHGDATFTSSVKFGSAAGVFDGAGDYVSNTALNPQLPGDCTLSAWIRSTASHAYQARIIDLAQAGATGLQLCMTPGGAIGIDNSGGPTGTVWTSDGYNNGLWHHLVVTREGSTYKLYVNGSFIGSTSGTAPVYARIFLGSRATTDSFFNGLIDEVAIYNQALSPEEIKQHYEAGSPREATLYRSPRFDLGVKTKPTEMIVSKTAPSGTDLKVYARSGNSLTLANISESVLRDTTKEDFDQGIVKTNTSITPTANEISSLIFTITDTTTADFENGVANQAVASNNEVKLKASSTEEVLDQAYTGSDRSLSTFYSPNSFFARYISPTQSGYVSKIELLIAKSSGCGSFLPMVAQLRTGTSPELSFPNGKPTSVTLASVDYTITQFTSPPEWRIFDFTATPTFINAGQRYWIVLKPLAHCAYTTGLGYYYTLGDHFVITTGSGGEGQWTSQSYVGTLKLYLRFPIYHSSGSLTRTIDFGQKVNINDISWTESIQTGVTDVTFDIQTSSDGINWDTPITGLTDPSGGSINRYNRYLKYTMNLSTTDSSKTPIVFDVSVSVGGLNGTYESSIIDLNSTSPIDLLAIQADLPTTETQISIAVRAGSPATSTCTSGVNWQTDWDSSPVFNLNSNPSGANPKILTHQPSITQPYRCWQYRIIGKTNGNATWIVRDVFLVPQPEGYGKLKLVADKANTYPNNIQQAEDGRYFQYLVLGASNGSASWNVDKVELTTKFSSFNIGKRYQIAKASLTDNDDLLYRIHYSLENTDNYLSVTAWQDSGDKTASNTLSHTFPASTGQALRWLRFNRVSSTGSPPTSPTAIAFLAKEANVYVIKKKTNGTFEELPRSEGGTTRAYYGTTLPTARIGKTSETQTYQLCTGSRGPLRRITLKALPHPEGTDGYKCASLSWTGSANEDEWIDAAEVPDQRATITPQTLGYGDEHQTLSIGSCKNFHLRTRVPLEGVTEGLKKIRFYFEGEVL